MLICAECKQKGYREITGGKETFEHSEWRLGCYYYGVVLNHDRGRIAPLSAGVVQLLFNVHAPVCFGQELLRIIPIAGKHGAAYAQGEHVFPTDLVQTKD